MSGRGNDVPTMTADTRVPTQPPVSEEAPAFRRYVNSKIAATNLVHEYAASHPDSHFSLVNLMPGFVLGPEELARSKQEAMKGSNLVLGWLFFDMGLGPWLGSAAGEDPPMLAETVHLEDVVEAHIKALDIDKVPGKERNFLLCSNGPTGPVVMDAADTVRKNLSQEVADGKIPFAGKLGRLLTVQSYVQVTWLTLAGTGTITHKFDATPAERELLGHPFRSYEEMVTDTVKWYVHLKDS